MDIKEVISNKDIIISIKKKIDLIKRRADSVAGADLHPILQGVGEFFGEVIFFVGVSALSIFFYNYVSLLFNTTISIFLSLSLSIGLPALLLFKYDKYLLNKTKKRAIKKGKYYEKSFNNLHNYVRGSFCELNANDLERRLADFSKEEREFIALESNDNLVHINEKTFAKEAYEYMRENQLTEEEFKGLKLLFKEFELDIEESKYEDAFELSKIKNKESIKLNKNIVLNKI